MVSYSTRRWVWGVHEMTFIEWLLVIFFVFPIVCAILFAAAVVINIQIQEEAKRNGNLA